MGHRLITSVSAPDKRKARRKPHTPSPLRTSPRPVSQAERVTSFVPHRLRLEASKAVRMPSSVLFLFRLAPLSASPDRRSGFSIAAAPRTERESAGGCLLLPVVTSVASCKKNPCVAICRTLGASTCLIRLLDARAPV